MKLYAIRDLKADSFQQVWQAANDEVAIRQFGILCKDNSTLFGMCPTDFDLYLLGDYDEKSGDIISHVVSLVNGNALIKPVFSEVKHDGNI